MCILPERVLVAEASEELISSGASNTWHDLALYLIARYIGATEAQEVARTYALQWHQDGLTPFMIFEGKRDHGDAEIAAAQRWLAEHFSVANPVDEMIRRSKLAERTFKRRFTAATGLAPLEYVQRLRVEDAKRRLERTDAPVDEIGWRVGYEDAASSGVCSSASRAWRRGPIASDFEFPISLAGDGPISSSGRLGPQNTRRHDARDPDHDRTSHRCQLQGLDERGSRR